MRKIGVKRMHMGQRIVISGEFGAECGCRYLGCIVNEHVENKMMVDSRALCVWLRRCRVTVGEVQGQSFAKLLEAIVVSVLLYGADVWGCCKRMETLEQVW